MDIKEAVKFSFEKDLLGCSNLKISDSIVTLFSEEQNKNIDPNSTYIITGGTRGLGLEIARWLVSKGAKHLLLISRSGITTSEGKKFIHEMELCNVLIKIAAIDIANIQSVDKLMNDISSFMPPIKGIFHCAMVLEDKFIVDINKDSYEKVILPKVAGAINLHNATLNEPIDFFISFSSIATLIGNSGQVNYIAANTFSSHFLIIEIH